MRMCFIQVFPICVKETRCRECKSEMFIVAFIENLDIIRKILKYLDLWEGEPVRTEVPVELVYVPIDDGWEQQNEGFAS